ncbi:GNAT family N-acetyltransferase [Planomicrobium sp. CPCC 101079]|uniref:GNAT family N-acetyltransferase n=1 Tax=Planomicrobium sp. CPCC 101079 TaxID=2599618 RepID=UPI0011B7EFC7|nr:GNAT family N-acetyltransferase [Planomicrobium sp. CPCC 101079]TWT03613.1 GNAT family N-acetyltransferase [Planomicrobium sp. CPCC 101079]
MGDLYVDQSFGRLYEAMENGTCEAFDFFHALGTVKHVFIKREIPIRMGGKVFYELVTPCGYGGPMIAGCKEGDKRKLVYEFALAFERYCKDHHIVWEYVRFHPVIGNAEACADCYDLHYIGEAFGTDLQAFADPVQEEFSESAKRAVWKALEAGVEYRITEKPKNLHQLYKFYSSFADKGEKKFKADFFWECGKSFREQIVLVEAVYKGQVIGMGLNFLANNILHTHLSVVDPSFCYLSPEHVMHFGLTLWGKEQGVDLLLDGSWLIDPKATGMHIFKKQFSQNTSFKYCIGQRVWDRGVYRKLCGVAENGETDVYSFA